MYKDIQERVDAYLRGEMDADSRSRFEANLKSDKTLAQVYRETKAISDAIANRRQKLDMMVRWDREEKINEQLIRRKRSIRRWTIAMSAAACLAIGFFVIRPMFMTTPPTPTSLPGANFTMPDFGNEAYYRGGDSSMQLVDSLITAGDYNQALLRLDSLLLDYNNELKQYNAKDSLTEKDEYNKALCEGNIENIDWRKANLLVALGKIEEAKHCLKSIIDCGGLYAAKADSLLQTL